MKRWLRYGWPRRDIIRLTGWFPVNSWARNKLLDFLYPSDCVITFPASPNVERSKSDVQRNSR